MPPWAKLVQANLGFGNLSTSPQTIDLGNLPKGQYVLLYRGVGAYHASQAGHTGWLTVWGFCLMWPAADGPFPVTLVTKPPIPPAATAYGLTFRTQPGSLSAYQNVGLDTMTSTAIPGTLGPPTPVFYYDQSLDPGAPIAGFPLDLAASEAAAESQTGCFVFCFVPSYANQHFIFAYLRDSSSESTLSVTAGTRLPYFDLWLMNPSDFYGSPCVSLIKALCQSAAPFSVPKGAFKVIATYQSLDNRFNQYLNFDLIGLTSPAETDFSHNQINGVTFNYPNTTPNYSTPSFNATLRVKDVNTGAIVRQDAITFAPVVSAYSYQLLQSGIGGVHGKNEYYFYVKCSGNMDFFVQGPLTSATGTGFTLLTDLSNYPLNGFAPDPPTSLSTFRFDLIGQFTSSIVDITINFTDGVRSYSLTWHLTGVPT